MVRLLLIEALLEGVLGAIAFRLMFAFIRRTVTVWILSIVAVAAITVFVGERMDARLLHDLGGTGITGLPSFTLRALRAGAWLAGSALAWLALRRRAARGLEPPPELPPGDL